ncbi:MAG: hypothetical protein E7323_06485 [Clostridiales bacterium]|nr:hypothetical protein [Clostridiales bacterium]
MELRLLDDVMTLPGLGVILMSMDDTRAEGLVANLPDGATLTDALGNRHTVTRVEEQDGLYLLHLPEGDAAYWERLFRKVTVDATLVTLAAGEGEEA